MFLINYSIENLSYTLFILSLHEKYRLMTTTEMLFPDYIFESSWEVCNKVGGIYAVLSTRAKTLQDKIKDRIIFIGPDCWKEKPSPYFIEDSNLFSDWKEQADTDGLHVRAGRWDIPGHPIAILVDFDIFYNNKNDIYAKLWEDFQVDSLHAYGDYDEASMFSYAAGRVVESFYRFYLNRTLKMVYHGNEWMTGLGLLYIKKHLPEVATIFTTHATSIGRSIAGNNKPLYQYLDAYNGDQMAGELNMQSKHSIEKQTAHHVDCFTTVSDITAQECAKLLDKPVDAVLPNGFEANFVAKGTAFSVKRRQARKRMLEVANALLGTNLKDDTLIVSTSGRYEYRNKGIDVFIEAMSRLRHEPKLNKNVVAFIEVPAWVAAPRQDLQQRLQTGNIFTEPLPNPVATHCLHNANEDRVMGMMNALDIRNDADDKIKIIFVPCYLTGHDGIFDMPYYDIIIGGDLSVYPSYYEPWGYTPLESIAFKVPTITTDLAGFGLWVNTVMGHYGEIEDGVKVVRRTDYNYNEVVEAIKDTVVDYANMAPAKVKTIREKAGKLSKKALWSHFIAYYERAYDMALRKAENRKIQKQ